MLLKGDHSYYASIDHDEIIKKLNTSSKGLSSDEAKQRLKEFGHNTVVEKKENHLILEFLSHLKNPLIIVLIFAAAISGFLKQTADVIIIIIIILLSATLDFFLEHRAHKATEKLRESVKTTATVIRDSEKKEVKKEDLCVGDVIFLSAGDMVPADARIISCKDFFVNQAVLTGESMSCEKTELKIESKQLSITDMTNIVFLGTSIVSGSANAVVIKTGTETEFGKIAKDITSRDLPTEFEKGITNFGYLIMRLTFFLVLSIFLFNSILKHNMLESFIFAIAVSVGLTPELLPMIMSITMAKGSINMAKKGTIVKKLPTIPNFGSMDLLCTDKTGTLTEAVITLVRYLDLSGKNNNNILKYVYLNSSFHTGIENPLDTAVLAFKKVPIEDYKKIDEIPFDFARKMMSMVVEKSKKRLLITKGAPEEIFKICRYYHSKNKRLKLERKAIERIKRKYYAFSKEGHIVLAVAIKKVSARIKDYTKNDESEMELCGFVTFRDPPKKEVKDILLQLEKTGIEIKVVTGDNELVTKQICNELNIDIKGILLGSEIDTLSDDALKVKVEKTTIFARFSPEQKNRVMLALKVNGHVVGFMGDGINDAPSLRTADVGISVNSAVDVAKETAEIVLTRKSLKQLGEGVLEGRKTFGNTMKYIMMGLSSNFGNMFSVAIAVLFLPFLPMLPIQILLNNLIYDISQISIPADNVDKEFIQKPKRWNMKFIKSFMLTFGPISSIFDLVTFFVLYSVFKLSPAAFQTGWFIESLATQILVIHIIRTKRLPFVQSCASKYVWITSIGCFAFGWLLPYTPIGHIFGFVALPLNILLAIVGIVAIYLITAEITKRIFYLKHDF